MHTCSVGVGSLPMPACLVHVCFPRASYAMNTLPSWHCMTAWYSIHIHTHAIHIYTWWSQDHPKIGLEVMCNYIVLLCGSDKVRYYIIPVCWFVSPCLCPVWQRSSYSEPFSWHWWCSVFADTPLETFLKAQNNQFMGQQQSLCVCHAIPSNVFKSIGNSNLVVWAEPEPSPSIQEVDAKAFCKKREGEKNSLSFVHVTL